MTFCRSEGTVSLCCKSGKGMLVAEMEEKKYWRVTEGMMATVSSNWRDEEI